VRQEKDRLEVKEGRALEAACRNWRK
jgi:hypothetical protein